MKLKSIGIATLGMIALAQPALAAQDYPERLQLSLSAWLQENAKENLKSATNRYNETLGQASPFPEAAKKLGLSDRDIQQIQNHYFGNLNTPLPRAEFKSGEIQIDLLRITLNSQLRPVLQFNGKQFQWNWKQSTTENLKRLDAVFISHEMRTSTASFFSNSWSNSWSNLLLNDAWADELFRIKAAGLQLYFIVGALGEAGEQLYRLNSKVKSMTALCNTPESSSLSDDPFTKAVMQGSLDAQRFQGSVLLKNCQSVKDYAKKTSGSISTRIPNDLCSNLDQLAQCVRNTMNPASTSNTKNKAKAPKDAEEWFENSPQGSGGSAR
jgi:hypothetical protein